MDRDRVAAAAVTLTVSFALASVSTAHANPSIKAPQASREMVSERFTPGHSYELDPVFTTESRRVNEDLDS